MKAEALKKSALLVIDMQRYFIHPDGEAFLDPPRSLVRNITALIDAFRFANRPIVFTRHAHRRGKSTGQMGRWWNDDLPWYGDRDAELIDDIKPRRGEAVITKTRYSALEKTSLDSLLKRARVNTVVICGVMTNLCVETTARHAFTKDYQPVIVEDACATKSADYHNASILNLRYGFAFIKTTRQVISNIKKQNAKRQIKNQTF